MSAEQGSACSRRIVRWLGRKLNEKRENPATDIICLPELRKRRVWPHSVLSTSHYFRSLRKTEKNPEEKFVSFGPLSEPIRYTLGALKL